MPITFAKQFGVTPDVIKLTGVFDVILDVDTRVFIDPALIDLCIEPEFMGARAKIEKYFSDVITLLNHSKKTNDMYWHKAEYLLTFREITGTCFGYSQNSTGGNAIGAVLRQSILGTIKELIAEGETDPTLFELLGVFQEGIGCDRVSDLITFVLQEDILKYTERVVTTAKLETHIFTCNRNHYRTVRNPFNKKPLLLLPSIMLSPLPVANSFDDISRICAENDRVRAEINRFLDLGRRNILHKSEILSLMHSSPAFRKALITAYKAVPPNAYDFSVDPAGEYAWYGAAKDYTERFPLDLAFSPLKTIEDVLAVTLKICEQFKTLIEENGLHALLFDTEGKPKPERAAQLLFFGIADSYCTANDIDLTKEGNVGQGPLDFKLSRGAADKVIVETKLTSNNQLKHGIEIQLPIYMKQEKTKKAVYLIIDTGHTKALNNFIVFYNNLEGTVKNKIPYIIIDATPKPSASKAFTV